MFVEGIRLAFSGVALRIPLALYCARVAEKEALSPAGSIPYWALAASIIVLTAAASVAVLVPALRASSVDAIRALNRG